jgi:DNA mismatch endonuclease (patch repair protein)
MADIFSKTTRSRVMSAIRSKHNKSTEAALSAIFRAYRITGWRRQIRLPGSPDFTFPRRKLVVFVDGCFWHDCPWHGHKPHSNRAFWRRKLVRNKARDRRVTKELRRAGWCVVRFWEHQFKEPERIVTKLKLMLRKHKEKPRLRKTSSRS